MVIELCKSYLIFYHHSYSVLYSSVLKHHTLLPPCTVWHFLKLPGLQYKASLALLSAGFVSWYTMNGLDRNFCAFCSCEPHFDAHIHAHLCRFLLVNASHSAGPLCTVYCRFIQVLQHSWKERLGLICLILPHLFPLFNTPISSLFTSSYFIAHYRVYWKPVMFPAMFYR